MTPLTSDTLITPHGDRKPEYQKERAEAIINLITPHGDRKLGDFSRRGGYRSTAHYPSWGSETRRTAEVTGVVTELITPHGDRKPEVDQRPRRRTPLPLITPHGDRKQSGNGVRRRYSVLITPHGDRKRVSKRPECS